MSPVTRTAVMIGLATGVYGVSFGALAPASGLTVAQTCAMSLLVFTGASQFAFIGVLGAGGTAAAALAPPRQHAGRNGVYGLTLVPIMRGHRARRALEAQLVIDESTAMAHAQRDPDTAHRAFLATGLSVFVCWNAGTLIGALLGEGLGDPKTLGLDAMFPAAFVVLLGYQLDRPGARAAALAGGVIAFSLVPVMPPGVPIVAAALGVIPGLLVARRQLA